MNLDEAKFNTVLTANKKLSERIEASLNNAPVKTAEVIEDDIIICPHCEVIGSKPVLDMTGGGKADVSVCDCCGCVWPVDNDEGDDDYDDTTDLEEALDLLMGCIGIFNELLHDTRAIKVIGWDKEKEIIEMKATIDVFLEQFPWKES